jgi:hypothetical protein
MQQELLGWGMANALKEIPEGWELVPVGEKINTGCMVCSYPFSSWEALHYAPFIHEGMCQPADSPSLPFGHYIRKIK